MRRRVPLATLAVSLLACLAAVAPVHAAAAADGTAIDGVEAACLAPGAPRGPPCGYINPILDLHFPDKPVCTTSGGDIDLSKCIPLPEVGGSVTYAGTVRWYWKLSEDGTYPPDTNAPIDITFSTVTNNPSWLPFSVTPEKFTITAVDMLDPRNTKVDDSGSSPVVYYWYERPINVTFTRDGSPSAEAAQKIALRDGLLETYVRGRSTPSGTTFNAAFGGEYFRFNATSLSAPGQPVKGASGPTAIAGAALLLGVAAIATAPARRRAARQR